MATKAQMIDYLVTNCDCHKGRGGREALNAMAEGQLTGLVEQAERLGQLSQLEPVANAALTGFQHGGAEYRFDPERGSFTVNEPDPDDDDEDEDDEDEEPAPRRRRTNNQVPETPMTDQEWLDTAPPNVRRAVTNALEQENQQRARLITEIVEPLPPERRQAVINRLLDKELDELRDLALIPQSAASAGRPEVTNRREATAALLRGFGDSTYRGRPEHQDDLDRLFPGGSHHRPDGTTVNYAGAGGGPDLTPTANAGDDELLLLPQMDYTHN